MTNTVSNSHKSAEPDQSDLAKAPSVEREPSDAAVFRRGVLAQLALDQCVTEAKGRKGGDAGYGDRLDGVIIYEQHGDEAMSNPRLNVGVASNDRRMFEIVIPDVGKIVCETSTKLPGAIAGREDERKTLAKLHGRQLSEALATAIEGY